jgi:hypothetical protein
LSSKRSVKFTVAHEGGLVAVGSDVTVVALRDVDGIVGGTLA